MNIVLGGLLENAILRAAAAYVGHLSTRHDSNKAPDSVARHHQAIFRWTDAAMLGRAATFVVLARRTDLALVDWRFPYLDNLRQDALGIYQWMGPPYTLEDDSNIELLAAFALHHHAFSRAALATLQVHRFPNGEPASDGYIKKVAGMPVDGFALRHLCRLLLQANLAAKRDFPLVLCELDREVLAELLTFVEASEIPIPFDLPEVRGDAFTVAEQFAGGLINFNPPDILAVQSVRSHPLIKSYADTIREQLIQPSTLETQKSLVAAMREAADRSGRIAGAQSAYEVINWVAKPFAAYGATIAVGAMKFWLKRERTKSDWFLMSAKMQEIAITDYLVRTDNL